MTSEQAQPDLMVLRLQAIVAATDELARCPDIASMCRRAVEFARKSLGLERCAIFLEDRDLLAGTYSSETQRETTDEHQQRFPINEVWLERIRALQPLGLRWRTVEESRRDWDSEYAQPVGDGWIVFTPIHAAQKLIGLFFNDAAISGAALDSTQQEFVSAFCSLLGSVIERKQVEEALQRERNLLRLLIDAVPANVYIKDAQSRFVEANLETALQIGEKTPNDLIGKTDFDFFSAELAGKYFADEQAILQSGQPLRNLEEWNFDQRTQKKRWFLTTKVPILDEHGQVTGLVGVGLDITERKQVQEQIAQERDLLRTLIDQLPDYIFIKDADGRFINSNVAHNRIAQVKDATELLGKSAFDVFPPDLAARFYADDQRVLQTGQALVNVERTSVDAEGQERTVLTTKVPLRDASGKVSGLVGISRDITERKQAEQALQAKDQAERSFQASLKALYEITIELTQIDGLDDFYRRVVELALERLGFDRFGLLLYNVEHASVVGTYGTDAQGKLADEHHLQFEPSLLTGILKRTLDPSQRFAFDEHAQLFSNREPIGFGWNAAALLTNGEQSLGWVAADNGVQHQPVSKALLDILALYAQTVGTLLGRKRAEQALRVNEAKLQTFFEVLPVGVALLNDAGQIVEMNPGLERILTISRDGLLNGAYRSRKYTFGDGRPMAHSEFPSARVRVERQAIHDVVVGVVKEDETTVWVSVSAAPLPLAKSGVITVTTDITERKRAEKQAFALAAEQQRVKLLRDFITDVSHDFRTPLTLIGTSAYLIGKTTDPVKLTRHSQRIEAQMTRLRLLLDNFVQLADLEQMASLLQFQPTDLNEVIETLLERIQREVAEKQQHLDYRCETSSLVIGDRSAFTQAITPVVVNALHYTPPEGKITLRLCRQGENAVLEVADTGIGIRTADLPHIFESFYRVDSARSMATGGAGLGLSIARRIIELMKGHIEVASEFGAGSVFKIYLPIYQEGVDIGANISTSPYVAR